MSKNSLVRQVRAAYRQDKLGQICTLPESRFGRAFGMETVRTGRLSYRNYSGRPEDYYHFRDNGSRVLAVAHLDTVVRKNRRTPHFRATQKGPLIVSGALDDRLGAYVILSLLPSLGITCDWLLTVGEESAASTAEDFDPWRKEYDWVIEFDRGGTDVVMYQYEDEASRQAVEESGAAMGRGSFSDIASLEHLGVKAFNWGVGYRGDYHSEKGYAFLNDTFAMVAKYLRFHDQNAGMAMPHEPGHSGYNRQYTDTYDCAICGQREVDAVTWYCMACGSCADCGLKENDGCMCYIPENVREKIRAGGYSRGSTNASENASADEDEAEAEVSGQPEDEPAPWRGMSWDDYLATRPSSAGERPKITDNWHEGTAIVPGHLAGADRAQTCLRCAARWPHPVTPAGTPDRVELTFPDADLAEAHREGQAVDSPGPLIQLER